MSQEKPHPTSTIRVVVTCCHTSASNLAAAPGCEPGANRYRQPVDRTGIEPLDDGIVEAFLYVEAKTRMDIVVVQVTPASPSARSGYGARKWRRTAHATVPGRLEGLWFANSHMRNEAWLGTRGAT